jgi:hypothetical protein
MFSDFVSGVISKLGILLDFDLLDNVRTVLNKYIDVKNVTKKISLFLVDTAKGLGAQYTFEKPVNPSDLLAAVYELLKEEILLNFQ